MKTIVLGYDGTRPAERALGRAAELAEAFRSTVIVASVASPLATGAAANVGAGGAFGLAPFDYSAGAKAVEDVWQQHRARVSEELSGRGIACEFAASIGRPVEEIVELAEEHGADLIVVGTREPGFVERLFVGSVSQGVARRAHCDVLIVHAGHDELE
jgi:nucleotide-binding universal stress UspA family protein